MTYKICEMWEYSLQYSLNNPCKISESIPKKNLQNIIC